ncbi:hypothetical protein PybrP1_001765 [[Pythium] brassicae (nom. inval.)]|nr:hypothetical protein PybrP1_001765 [[Pythium] brassicae (nom. inval.)]
MKTVGAALVLALALGGGVSASASARPEVTRYTALTGALPLTQGEVTNTYHKLPIPRGPIAVYRFEADVVEKDADGNVVPVPNFDAYLHHHVVGSVHKHYAAEARKWTPMKPVAFSRSVGFGAGTESRGTPQQFEYPYAFLTVAGENEWVANVHVINTRKMAPARAQRCLECPCTSADVITRDTVNGMQFAPDACNAELRAENNTVCAAATYHGGLRCCEDAQFCLEPAELAAAPETSTYYLRYTIEYAAVTPANRALYLAGCCDASGDETHHGNVEYDVPVCDPALHPGCVHTLSTRQPIDIGQSSFLGFTQGGNAASPDREVELVYAVGHQHRGGLGIHMYDEATGELLCSSLPTYGTGAAVGDESGYVVAMSTCTFDPPRRMRASDLVRVVSLYNNTKPHTGVMSLFYVALAEVVAEPQAAAAAVATLSASAEAAGTARESGVVARVLRSPLMVVGPVAAVLGCAIVFVLHMAKRHGYQPLDMQATA